MLQQCHLKEKVSSCPIPIPIWADDEVLPPAKQKVRERARIISITHAMKSGHLLGLSGGMPAMNTAPAPTLEELGDDDVVLIDMTELIGKRMVVPYGRTQIQDIFEEWHSHMPCARESLETTFGQRMAELRNPTFTDSELTHSIVFACLELAVLGRVLYNRPICVVKEDAPSAPDTIDKLDKEGHPALFIHDPLPEMMHPIVIPPSVADKGGYIVAGEFREGRGIETVHLEFSDFQPDDDVMLHLRDESDSFMLTGIMPNKDVISEMIMFKQVGGNDKAALKRMHAFMRSSCDLPGTASFEDRVRTDDPAAYMQLSKALKHRKGAALMRQVMDGTPIRLFYSSDHYHGGHNPNKQAYLEHVMNMCFKKLYERDGFHVIEM